MKIFKRQNGFTIVELLVVVVVIAILASITVVSYNGITERAKEVALKSDLSNGATQLGIIQIETSAYPTDVAGLKKSDSTTFQYIRSSDTAFCLGATSPSLASKSFYITEAGSIQIGSCPSMFSADAMQSLTASQCAALATFTGSNTAAIIDRTDSRGGTTRTYQVAKLADGKCWMLSNLKLGSTTGTTVLTPADSNVTSNFTLPRVATTGSLDYDLPQAFGPIPGDTNAGATNYGYLYNWPAATAGATRATNPDNSGDAANSICPVNWRLPKGNTSGEFAMLNAKMNNAGASGPSVSGGTGYYQNWLYAAPFKGVLSGYWYAAFGYQNSMGYFWSSTSSASPNLVFLASSTSSNIYPGHSAVERSFGNAVRCLLN